MRVSVLCRVTLKCYGVSTARRHVLGSPVLRSSDGQRCRMVKHTDVPVDISSIDRCLKWVGDNTNITAHKDVCTVSSAIEIRNNPSYFHVNPLLIRLRHIDYDRKDRKFLPRDKLSNCEIQQNGHDLPTSLRFHYGS